MRILVSAATVFTLVGVALVLLLTPLWTHFALRAAGSAAPGGSAAVINASDQTVAHLLTLGDFKITAADGAILYTDEERGHMRDVQLVLYLFLGLAAAAALFLALNLVSDPGAGDWRAVARGAGAIVLAVIALGIVGLIAFGPAFEIFHRIFFPGGNWSFPPDSNLIRLYPVMFWQLSSGALGVLAASGGLGTWWFARRRAARLATR